MITIAITGGIASGKSHISKLLHKILPKSRLLSSDAIVANIYQKDSCFHNFVKKNYPQFTETSSNGTFTIHRKELGNYLFKNPQDLKKFETILFPIIKKYRDDYIKLCTRQRFKYLIIEIPLLFENNLQKDFDIVIGVTANLSIRKQRALKRSGINADKFSLISKQQISPYSLHTKADLIIRNTYNPSSIRTIKNIISFCS